MVFRVNALQPLIVTSSSVAMGQLYNGRSSASEIEEYDLKLFWSTVKHNKAEFYAVFF